MSEMNELLDDYMLASLKAMVRLTPKAPYDTQFPETFSIGTTVLFRLPRKRDSDELDHKPKGD